MHFHVDLSWEIYVILLARGGVAMSLEPLKLVEGHSSAEGVEGDVADVLLLLRVLYDPPDQLLAVASPTVYLWDRKLRHDDGAPALTHSPEKEAKHLHVNAFI